MPAKNSRKVYAENGYYHIYNRGVEKRTIFNDQQDYSVFLNYLKQYLEPKNEKELYSKLSDESLPWPEKEKCLQLIRLNNFSKEIELVAYCLMPNHFHFLIKQKSSQAIDQFTNSLLTRFVMYFNKKNQRVGPLFQGVYKATLIDSEEYLLHLSRYIHRNPLELPVYASEHQNLYTSLPEYLEKRKTNWVKPTDVLSYFNGKNRQNSYESFVNESDDLRLLENLILEDIS